MARPPYIDHAHNREMAGYKWGFTGGGLVAIVATGIAVSSGMEIGTAINDNVLQISGTISRGIIDLATMVTIAFPSYAASFGFGAICHKLGQKYYDYRHKIEYNR